MTIVKHIPTLFTYFYYMSKMIEKSLCTDEHKIVEYIETAIMQIDDIVKKTAATAIANQFTTGCQSGIMGKICDILETMRLDRKQDFQLETNLRFAEAITQSITRSTKKH